MYPKPQWLRCNSRFFRRQTGHCLFLHDVFCYVFNHHDHPYKRKRDSSTKSTKVHYSSIVAVLCNALDTGIDSLLLNVNAFVEIGNAHSNQLFMFLASLISNTPRRFVAIFWVCFCWFFWKFRYMRFQRLFHANNGNLLLKI